jgi:hypothetical protein
MDAQAFLALALSLPEAALSSHMGAADIRVRGKIFAQPPARPDGSAILKLTREQQEMMCAAEPELFTPVEAYWGRQGWTRFAVAAADAPAARAALLAAWRNVAPKTLVKAHDVARSRPEASAP